MVGPSWLAVPTEHDACGRCRPRRDGIRHDTARAEASGLVVSAPGAHTARSPLRHQPHRQTSALARASCTQRRLRLPSLARQYTPVFTTMLDGSNAPPQSGGAHGLSALHCTPLPPVGARFARASGVILRPARFLYQEAAQPRCGASCDGVKRLQLTLAPRARQVPDGRKAGGSQPTESSRRNRLLCRAPALPMPKGNGRKKM